VTNKSNGRSVVVTINDRGPFVRGRVIDVTPAAARVLGFSGLTQVTLNAGQDTSRRPSLQCLGLQHTSGETSHPTSAWFEQMAAGSKSAMQTRLIAAVGASPRYRNLPLESARRGHQSWRHRSFVELLLCAPARANIAHSAKR